MEKISFRGRTARHLVEVAHNFPLIRDKVTNGEARVKVYEKEKAWVCPEHLAFEEIMMPDFKMELLTSTLKLADINDGIIMQLHGGGYYGPIHNVYRDMAALYVEVSEGMPVLSVDYRVAPECPYPAALNDAVAAYGFILERGYDASKIIVAGDSAGGGLALALGHFLKDHDMPMPGGFITMSPWTDLATTGDSYVDNFDIDPIFGGTKESLVFQNEYYRLDSPTNPYVSPLYGDFTDFPPMLMQVGSLEMLLSDSQSVADKAKQAGCLVKLHVYEGMFHDFQMGLLYYPESKNAWIEVGKYLRYIKRDWQDV
ncbi:MAG: alpha/beta hydrolase fold domain-containing protein [Lachnospiraceae bacterium]